MLRSFLTLGAGEALARAMNVAAFLLLARALGKEMLGHFGVAASITSYALLLVQQGFDTVAAREVSRNPHEVGRFVRNIFGIRLLIAALVTLVVCVYAAVAGFHATSALLVVLSVTYSANALTPRWSFLALEDSRRLAIAALLSQVCFLAGALLIRSPSDVLWIAAAQVTGESAAAIYLWRALLPRAGSLLPALDWKFSKWLALHSWPILVSLLLGNMMYNFDILALGAFGLQAEIGVYLACYRCVTVFTPFLGALQMSILPGFARSFPRYELIRPQVRRLSLLVAVTLSLAALAMTIYSREILVLLFGAQFGEGAPILRVLAWSLPLQGLRGILRQVLMAYRLQRVAARNLAFGVAANVIADLLLIPRFGPLGCAISTVLSEVVFWVSCEASVKRMETKETSSSPLS